MATTESPVDQQTVEEIIRDWPNEPTEIAERVIERYGWPDEAAPSELLWYDNGSWKRTELYRDGIPHNFPKEHTDYLKQVIDYRVPPEKFDDLGRFDGSVYVDRTNGELASKCDQEAANVLALNLAHDIITGKMSVDDARQEYAVTMVKSRMGGSPEYTQRLQFSLPQDKQRDPDESIVTDAMKEEVKDQLEDVTTAEGG
ncbi:hypothetical protein [Halorarum salinum]|uniref:Uncharacterized protein n=1 Tax=Halorarum salinum TaxID=2743089 RepID=A0A7D5LBA6_9EURY|nr:hypothetical protein [Halobaculum salinum]QLG62786.1 hypothetical protein HUG12_14040 [Halobaculum salinum]